MEKQRLQATERELLEPGFRRAYQLPAKRNESPITPAATGRLAKLKKGERVTPRRVRIRPVETLPPAMSEAALIRAMQTRGIGRPSTYAATIETLVARGYAARNQAGELASTERGQEVCAFLIERFPELFTLDFTARMESQLDTLARGQVTYLEVLQAFWESLQAAIDKKAA